MVEAAGVEPASLAKLLATNYMLSESYVFYGTVTDSRRPVPPSSHENADHRRANSADDPAC